MGLNMAPDPGRSAILFPIDSSPVEHVSVKPVPYGQSCACDSVLAGQLQNKLVTAGHPGWPVPYS